MKSAASPFPTTPFSWEDASYPMFGVHDSDHSFVVLFWRHEWGIVVHPGSSKFMHGYGGNSPWSMRQFTPWYGAVTISA